MDGHQSSSLQYLSGIEFKTVSPGLALQKGRQCGDNFYRFTEVGKMSIAEAINQAIIAYKKQDWNSAEALCNRVLSLEGDYYDALNILGAVATQTQRLEEAAELLERAVTVQPQNAEAHNNLGVALQKLTRLEPAIESFRRAIVISPGYAMAFYNQGNALQALGRPDEAIASYERAIALKADYAEAYNNRGNALLQSGRLPDALESFDRAIAIKPYHAQAAVNRGLALCGLGRWEAAAAGFERAIAVGADFPEVHCGLANALQELGRLDAAVESYARAVALRPDYAEAHCNCGTALQKLRRFDHAVASYERAIAIDTHSAVLHCNYGNALQEIGRLDAAAASFERAIALNPEYTTARYALAALGRGSVPSTAPVDYVTTLFDSFADSFDKNLVDALDYQMPFVLARQFEQHGDGEPGSVLDLGCGTGLCGKAFAARARDIVGVDLSPRMLEKSDQRKLYSTLVCSDIATYIQATDERFDLIVCADVFIYIGDLEKIFFGVKKALRAGGWFSFSVEHTDRQNFELKLSRRYGHSLAYLESLAAAAGFVVKDILKTNLRKEEGVYLTGYAVLMRAG